MDLTKDFFAVYKLIRVFEFYILNVYLILLCNYFIYSFYILIINIFIFYILVRTRSPETYVRQSPNIHIRSETDEIMIMIMIHYDEMWRQNSSCKREKHHYILLISNKFVVTLKIKLNIIGEILKSFGHIYMFMFITCSFYFIFISTGIRIKSTWQHSSDGYNGGLY